MYDYNRGYSSDLEASGIMDITRLPKFSYYFFQSQRNPNTKFENVSSGPMVYIANNWTDKSPLDVRVFSNCQEVALYLNGRLIEKRKPDINKFSTHLAHPPFTFTLSGFEAGELVAKAYIGDKEFAEHIVRTPQEAIAVKISVEEGITKAIKNDVIFVYAKIVDANNTVVPLGENTVKFKVQGAEIIGQDSIKAEAGIAAILLKIVNNINHIRITVEADGLESSSYNLI